jgi:hypothetical protein
MYVVFYATYDVRNIYNNRAKYKFYSTTSLLSSPRRQVRWNLFRTDLREQQPIKLSTKRFYRS